jgi:hypothetical protein
MNVSRLMSKIRFVLAMTGAMSLLAFSAHAEQTGANSCSCQPATALAKPNEVKNLPRRGKVRSVTPPQKAVFGMIWNDTKANREYIFDGNEWVPHDNTVDLHYASKKAKSSNTGLNGGGK